MNFFSFFIKKWNRKGIEIMKSGDIFIDHYPLGLWLLPV